MINKAKCTTTKMNKANHKNLISKYKINFNPLLLPKLALIGYQLKSDPSFQVFLAKLQLFDKSAIERQNLFIEHMKKMIMTLEKEGEEIEDEILMVEIGREPRKEIKSCINLEEDKYRYGKILSNRLTDLNEFIFHIQRMDKQPIQQKQCKNILENQINKINRLKSEHKKSKVLEQQNINIKQQNQKYFKLSQFKLNEMKQNNKNINTMLKRKRSERKYKKYKTQAFQNLNGQQKQENFDDFEQNQGSDNTDGNQDNSKLASLVTNIDGKLLKKNSIRHNDPFSRISIVKIKRNQIKRHQTEASQNIQDLLKARRKRQKEKSVRYNIRNSQQSQVDQSQKNNTTSIVNIRSSKSIIKSDKMSRASQSQLLSKSRHYIQTNKKKSTKFNNNDDVDEQTPSDDDDEEKIHKTNSRLRTVKFSDEMIEEKNSYIKPKKYNRKFGLKDNKLSFKRASSINEQIDGDENNQQNIGSRKQLNSSRVVRRDAFQQPNGHPINNKSMGKKKRKGRILGVEANKHLQRLLMEENIQDMLLDNELYEKSHQLFERYKNKKGKGKYFSKKFPNDMSRSINKTKGDKQDILMQIDLENQASQDSQLYVPNEGLNVQPKDLKTIRQNFVQILPYQHKIIGQFYGGENFQNINHQFNTDEHGQFYFNRLVMNSVRNSLTDDYVPFPFPQSLARFQSLRFDFGKFLTKQLNNIQQKDMRMSSALVSYM